MVEYLVTVLDSYIQLNNLCRNVISGNATLYRGINVIEEKIYYNLGKWPLQRNW